MKRLFPAVLAILLLAGCSGEDLKKQVAQKSQLIAAQESEIKKLRDDLAAREADLKAQCEQRVQKLAAQHKHEVEGLRAKLAAQAKTREAEARKKQAPAASSKTRR
ncbi:MAG: hypothetical protein ACOZEN_01295 [Thermodesulfobacteriota bacterium]